MKANAPEKIYMTPSFGEPDNVLLASFSKSHLNFHRDIEYTRTDAFIKKACEWLTKHAKKYYFNKERYLGTEELVEDFEISMKM